MRGIEDLDYTLHRFWETESEGRNKKSIMIADEKKAVKLVQDSRQYKDDQYEMEIPWKRDPECFKNFKTLWPLFMDGVQLP